MSKMPEKKTKKEKREESYNKDQKRSKKKRDTEKEVRYQMRTFIVSGMD